MSIVIKIAGVDVTDDVRYADAYFSSQVNGTPAPCQFAIRDKGHSYGFVGGEVITLDIDAVRFWTGYVTEIKRNYSFPVVDTTNPGGVARWFMIVGEDINRLLLHRIVRRRPNPAKAYLPPAAGYADSRHPGQWAAGTPSDVVVLKVLQDYTNLVDDGITFNGVEDIGSPNPDLAGVYTGATTVADFMRQANAMLNGIFYITPGKDFVHRSSEAATTPYYITDRPK